MSTLDAGRAVFRKGNDSAELIFPSRDKTASNKVDVVSGAAVNRVPQQEPMMTRDGDVAASGSSASMDDTSERQAKLESLKQVVMHRRSGASDTAGGR
ncbi:hypothetical protein [Dyella sp. 2HG41-7]|uniref:hypothetical protein n=1 Tax=Dyella sp. 2HG41-7 TaxID=2883239 RepID=UPI001F28715C|nr:hypothetical protein [Dyella sp. 2HG41-7]